MTARQPLILPPSAAPAPAERRRPRICVCIPSHDVVNANFAMALAAALYVAGVKQIPVALANNKGSVVHKNRNNAVAEAQRLGAAKLLFIDSDMTFPVNAIERLMAHEKPIVGATYAQRTGLHKNLAKPLSGQLEDVHGLVEVAALPTGMLLIDMAVFERMKRPYFRMPFVEEDAERGIPPSDMGEDYDFCNRARTANIPVFMDTELSFEIIHWGEAGWRLSEEMCGRATDQPDAQIIELAVGTQA
jgi:hypothetical protein